jgi:hypothetical protein
MNAPADMAQSFAGIEVAGEYTLPPQSEKYFCYTKYTTEDLAIQEVQVQNGLRTHHVMIASTLGGSEPDGFSECPAQVKQTWIPLYGGGASTPGVRLPDTAAFKFPKDTQILMQLHLVNASAQAVTETTRARLISASGDTSALRPAGIFAVGNTSFNIPDKSVGYRVRGGCALSSGAPKAMDVFALFPHMHQRGRTIGLEYGKTEAQATRVYGIDDWSFGDQPMHLQTIKVAKGDFLRATCTFDNNDGRAVTYGESTFDEMCFMVLFYTPFDRLGACLNDL